VIKTLALEKTFLLLERAEAIKDKRFDIILVRLFGKIFDVLPFASKLLNENGKVIFYKVEGIEKEIDRAKKTAEQTHFELKSVRDIKLPATEIIRKLVIYQLAQ
jgi:16S rRNA G527 N7-methylase RsmG